MNNTLEEYKKAIKIKYETEKEGAYFDFLYSPSRGKLRDLCWLIFENNPSRDDLNIFKTLFGLDFDYAQKNKFKEQKDKFRPIETFFKGETDPSNIDAINLAAVLVDFQPRPFKKFVEKCRIIEPKEMEPAVGPIGEAELKNEIIEDEDFVDNKKKESKEPPKLEDLFLDFKDLFSKEKIQKVYPKKVITAAIGVVAAVSSVCLNFVQKKE
ncbi:hypothetical protein [Flavobacterium hungaricum]|uniref:Uncharacterized protein n=1 Tax=Flavobacterium hungaricum TaxID=2082725 RepID=A0ABR9TNF5_9FLAO|nr:hypothetical protein [Flavobacterium hungaricum]MBE8726896.1 hypothetical protein [Flavobacterium hungaricum]